MPKLHLADASQRPTHEGLEYPYLAITKLVVELPISNAGQRFNGGSLKAEIHAYLESEHQGVALRVYHPTFKRSLHIANFEPQTELLKIARAIVGSQVGALNSVEVVD